MQRFCLVQRLSLVSALLLVALPVPTYAEQLVPFKGNRTVTVMTRNVYHGVDAEFAQIAAATNRIFVRFVSGGVTRGATSVAVQTQ